jgi:uncharacterized protein with ATP-grasp and redox domains
MSKPDWIRTSEKDSFAEYTIKSRKPQILEKILAVNPFTKDVEQSLLSFHDEISKKQKVKPLIETVLDQTLWNHKLQEFAASSWFDLPWYFAEAFFYRRVLESTRYYQSSHVGFLKDPFAFQKREQMIHDLNELMSVEWLFSGQNPKRTLSAHMLAALWGNRADLSNTNVNQAQAHEEIDGGEHLLLLIDDIHQFQQKIDSTYDKVAYITDNVGRELFSDLALIEYLLSNNAIEYLTMIVKPAPLFVSDAMRKDVELSVQLLCEAPLANVQGFGKRLQDLQKNGRLIILEEPSLCGYHMFEEMPWDFTRNLSTFDLVIIKGDANYRRVIGDRHWEYTQPINEILDYFPTDLLLLRTLKSEIMVGLSAEQVKSLNRKYENWLVDGFCGVVQLVQKNR